MCNIDANNSRRTDWLMPSSLSRRTSFKAKGERISRVDACGDR